MSRSPQLSRRQFAAASAGILLSATAFAQQGASVPVPGTGYKVSKVGDDFEDPEWKYIPNAPKSSDENDKRQRLPAGASQNNRWFEPVMRGQPDMIKRIETPKGGVEGSQGALYLASIYPGIPGSPRNKVEQDDFCANCVQAMGGRIPISWQPNTIVRVYVPPKSQWENRVGASFGYRLGLKANRTSRKTGAQEDYWPGMIFRMEQKSGEEGTERYLQVMVRANQIGHDVPGPTIAEPGWYTLGMTCTDDGAVHYFFRAGVEALEATDRIASYYPYGFRATQFETFFFNTLTRDNGRTWSTPWVIDDAFLYLSSPPRNMRG